MTVGNRFAEHEKGFIANLALLIGGLSIAFFVGLARGQALAIDPNVFPATKLSADLVAALNAPTPPKVKWLKQDGGGRYVKVIIIGSGSDPELIALRSAIVAAKGSVYYRYQSVPGVSAMLPGGQVLNIAARTDVDSMSPNRPALKTASFLETTTGVNGIRSTSVSGARTGYDGSGVGIAVLDSGIFYKHLSFAADGGGHRIKKIVSMNKTSDAAAMGVSEWAAGVDTSAAYAPGTRTQTNYEGKINNSSDADPDVYGHGTQVASIAAGRSITGAPESAGIASNANIYDVRVLDDTGVGQIGDVLAGIDWVIYHSKDYNIRVLNLSLAADSTESFRTDPLCRAARAAVSAGLTVVVAAGNYGKNDAGAEQFGTITSPGNDPSVITVGSANSRNTLLRARRRRQHFQLARTDARRLARQRAAPPITTTCSSPTSSRRATTSSARFRTTDHRRMA